MESYVFRRVECVIIRNKNLLLFELLEYFWKFELYRFINKYNILLK